METGGLAVKPVEVYIDGSYTSPDKAGIGIWWGTDHKRNFSGRSRQQVCDSDTTEHEALILFLERIGANKVSDAPAIKARHFIVKTDSANAIASATTFIPAYREQGWEYCKSTRIELLQYLDALLRNGQRRNIQITMKYVPGHSGNVGNTEADRLARAGTRLPKVGSRDWTAEKFKLSGQISVADLPSRTFVTSKKRKRQEDEEEESEDEDEEEESEEAEHSASEDEESDDNTDDDDEECDDPGSLDGSDLDEDDAESSDDDVDVQPSAKKRKLNSGAAGQISVADLPSRAFATSRKRKRQEDEKRGK
ncbi:ribonuclease H-like protein [Hymenopellis radicata]|nr:ribonuclease H-like protein [Hymenopellis radicata]